jgi:4-hydroxybenzoate polyprenyltransferase
MMNKAQAWINLLRLSNTPTLISNVMVGLGLGMVAHQVQWSDASLIPSFTPLMTLVVITIALVCAYFGGLVLNDVVDVEHDRKHRPDRPIPMGVISKKQATLVGSTLLVLPVLIALCTQFRAAVFMLALSSCILLYTFLHRYLLPSLIFMGLCRGLVYVVAFSAFDVAFQIQPLLVFAGGIAFYTGVLTLIARNEHTHNKTKRWLVFLLLPAAFVPAMIYFAQFQMIFIFLALGLFTIWVTGTFVIFHFTTKSVHGIHAILAGFCLLDFVYLSIMGELNIAIVSGICFLFTIAAQRKIFGT